MALPMKYASFFSGIGGFELALDAAGFQHVFSCEIEPFCNEVFKARWGHECEAKDITTLKPEEIPDADLWVGGFPCQDLSVAGKRGGLKANRSGLVWRFLELAAVRRPHTIWLENVPGLLSSERGRDFALLLREMEDIGYLGTWRVLDAQYLGVPQRRRRVFVVGHLGADCFPEILLESKGGGGNSQKGRQKGKIASGEIARCVGGVSGGNDEAGGKGTCVIAHGVSASKGHHGHSSPRGDGTDDLVVGHAVSKSSGGGLGGRDGQDDYVVRIGNASADPLVKKPGITDAIGCGTGHGCGYADQAIAAPLTHGSHPNSNAPSRRREDDENIVFIHQHDEGANQNHVKVDGKSDAPDTAGPGAVVIPIDPRNASRQTEKSEVNRQGLGVGKPGDPAGTLTDGQVPAIAFQSTGGSRDVQAGEKSPPIKVGSGCDIPSPPAVAFTQNSRSEVCELGEKTGCVAAQAGAQQQNYLAFEQRIARNGRGAPSPVVPPLKAESGQTGKGDGAPSIMVGMSIRRLTPTECERLQGFPDGHTCLCGVRPDCPDRRIPPWIDPETVKLGGCGHSACGCKCSDSARYRALGNAVAVPVIRWIAERMKRCLT